MIDDLRACRTIYDLASLLSIPAKTLAFLLYKLPPHAKYTDICLSKKSGGTRHIKAPERRLKELQKQLSQVLYACEHEIAENHGDRRSFGFEKGKGIYDNAKDHCNRRWVFNLDLLEFFPSINFGRVRGYFLKNLDFQLDPKIATLVAQIACHDNSLPQGAPSSPVISNLVCGSLDFRLSKLAKRNFCNYSRYVDDITFSTNMAEFPDDIASKDANGEWSASTVIEKKIKDCGFYLNVKKTRMAYYHSRQTVTGLVVNKTPAPPREYYKNTRATIHKIMRGSDWKLDRFCDPFRHNCENEDVKIDEFAALEGRMSYIFQLHNRKDLRKDSAKFFNPTTVGKVYSDLLFLKYFTRSSVPIIVSEGLSDILYIKAAIKTLGIIPKLSEIDQRGNLKLLFDFYNFPSGPSRLIGLSGGSGNLGIFAERLHSFQKRLSTNVARRPLIILLDNDEGLKGIEGPVKNLYKVDININHNADFFKISPSTFIVKTPHLIHANKSCVEDFLDKTALNHEIDGKKFSKNNQYDKTK